MRKRKWILLSGGLLAALLIVGVVGVSVVSAQEPPPTEPDESEDPCGSDGGDHGPGGFGGGLLWARGGEWAVFDAAAEALGLTPEELFTELHDGRSLAEVAEAQGVDLEMVQEAQHEAQQAAIEQAVEDGTLTQEQADRMLERLEQDHAPMGARPGPGSRGRGRGEWTESEDE